MGIVVALDEGLYTATFLAFKLGMLTVDWLWISVDAGNNRVSVALVRVTIIVILEDYSLPSSISAGQYDDHLSRFHNLAHGCLSLQLTRLGLIKNES